MNVAGQAVDRTTKQERAIRQDMDRLAVRCSKDLALERGRALPMVRMRPHARIHGFQLRDCCSFWQQDNRSRIEAPGESTHPSSTALMGVSVAVPGMSGLPSEHAQAQPSCGRQGGGNVSRSRSSCRPTQLAKDGQDI